MIDKSLIDNALVIANNFENLKIKFNPNYHRGSPLTRLLEIVQLPDKSISLEKEHQYIGETYLAQQGVNQRYNEVLQEIVTEYTPFLKESIEYLTKGIRPLVDQVLQNAEMLMSDYMNQQPHVADIKMGHQPQVYSNQGFIDMVEEKKSRDDYIPANMAFPEINAEEVNKIKNYIQEFPSLGEDLKASIFTEELIVQVYTDVFTNPDPNKQFSDLLSRNKNRLYPLTALIIAIYYLNNIPNGVRLSEGSYERSLHSIIGTACQYVYNDMRRVSDSINSGYIVESINPRNNEIVVQPTLYQRYRDNGGTDEVLRGALTTDPKLKAEISLVSGKLATDPNGINAVTLESFREGYNKLEKMISSTNIARLSNTNKHNINKVRSTVVTSFRTIVNKNRLKAFSGYTQEDYIPDSLVDNFESTFNNKTINSYDDVEQATYDSILETFLPNSDLKYFLDEISRFMGKHDSLTLQEAASLALVYYLVSWLKNFNHFIKG